LIVVKVVLVFVILAYALIAWNGSKRILIGAPCVKPADLLYNITMTRKT